MRKAFVDDMVFAPGADRSPESDGPSVNVDELFPVYAAAGEGEHPRQHLVMTPWMLLDCLKAVQDETYALLVDVERSGLGEETRYGAVFNPLADRLEKINFGVAHMLKVLWRGGLWTDSEIGDASSTDGRLYRVIREPFTLGKPGSQPLPSDAPAWQRELLGIPLVPEPKVSSHVALTVDSEDDGIGESAEAPE
jgi:hypothetical protein